ncbi:neurocalcin-delta A-like [Galendromus occidentalis]|uniref:Neurocalcin-delta A-like n=1 Tax=Galendromus occidentalis TaxID=34638 RepID=A0AAJ6VYA0_9ACAR|nr:neurocalcin-delta A-like [Galendromus occidentalis]
MGQEMSVGEEGDASMSPAELKDFQGLTCFSEDDILHWYRSFCLKFPDGKMGGDDVEKLYTALFPYGTPARFREHVFRMIDADHDGEIDFREFLTCLAVVMNGNSEQKLRRAFCLYDVDGDGFITEDELSVIFQQMQLTGRMVLANPQHAQCAKNIVGKFDKDGDGKLDFEEFSKLAKTLPPIVDTIYRDVDQERDNIDKTT